MKARFGGLPTDVDIRALREAYGVPAVGASIAYDDVAACIKSPVGSNRFRTVTQMWRKRLIREHNVYLSARDNQFTAMSAPERVDHGAFKLRSGVRAMRKAHAVVGATDRSQLTEQQKAQADHVLHIAATTIQAARLQAKAKTPELPQGVGAA